MEFLCVGQSKLKVILTAEEARQYNIKSADGDSAGSEVRRSLRKILSEARERVGFDVGTEKVLIQLYPLEGGGYELFATKLGSLGERERRTVGACEGLTTYSGGRAVYVFPTLEAFTAAARAVGSREADCDVYLTDGGEYYISIAEHTLNGFSEFEILTEFGRRLSELPRHYLAEHARLLVERRGMEIFSKL